MKKQLAFAQFGAAARRIGALALGLIICTLGPGLSASAQQGTFTTFDAPGAATGNGFGTVALSINPAGAIMGYYNDANAVFHGFLRARDATIATFDPPGSAFTIPGSINSPGTIAGFYFDAGFVPHGFLRARDGTFTTFDLPAGSFVVTSGPPSINPEGAITGTYLDASFGPRGFLHAPDGTFTTFNAPDASGTFANSINPAGAIAGYYFIVTIEPSFSIVFHGLLRAPDGTITTFDVPGALDTFATSNSINPAGTISGNYYDASDVSHGYLRAPDGTFTTFDVPGAGTGAFQGTGLFGVGINAVGAIAGTYTDASNVVHGFLRTRDGTITTYDPPGSVGTFADSINPAGAITGSFTDASGTIHGFLREP